MHNPACISYEHQKTSLAVCSDSTTEKRARMMSSRIPPLTKSNNYTRRNPEQMLPNTIEKALDVSEDSSSEDDASVRSQSTPGLKRKVSIQPWGIPVNVIRLMHFTRHCFLWRTPAAALTRHHCFIRSGINILCE